MKKYSLQTITIIAFLSGLLVFLITELSNIHILTISHDSIKAILSAIIGTSGSIVGFLVIYLSISFENLKKNYGKYGVKFFQSNRLILIYLSLLIITILFSFFSFILVDTNTFFKMYLINISFFYFVVSLILLMPYGYLITKESSSIEVLDSIIEKISQKEFVHKKVKAVSQFGYIVDEENNNYIIISEILINNTIEKNNRYSNAIFIQLFNKLNKLIDDKNINEQTKLSITRSFCSLVKEVFYINLNNRNNNGMITCLGAINSLNQIIANKRFGEGFLKEIFDLMEFVCKSLIESENETIINEALWTYYHVAKDQLYINAPKENEIWKKSDNPEFYVFPINSKEAFEKDSFFDLLEEFTSYNLNRIIERTFLCKNYHIIEDSVGILSSFVHMIAWSNNLGDFQKHRLGGMLSHFSISAIKRFTTIESTNKTSYLSLYVGSSFIVDLLKENTLFSKSVFTDYIDLINYLYNKDKLSSYDFENIFGTGRLIVANIDSIATHYEDLESLLDALNKMTLKETNKEESELVIKGITSFLSIMKMRNVNSEKVKELIQSFL